MHHMQAELSNKIANMGAVCAFLVVAIHVEWSPCGFISINSFMSRFIKEGLADLAVPFFFVVSGYFIGKHVREEGWYARAVRKRIRTLLVPYMLWIVVAFLLTAPLALGADIIAQRPLGSGINMNLRYLLENVGIIMDRPPVLVPLWYIRCLFILVCATPFILWMERKFCHVWLVCSWISWLYVSAQPLPLAEESFSWLGFFRFGCSLMGLTYYSLGVSISQNEFARIASAGNRWFAVLSIVFACCIRLCEGLPVSARGASVPFLMYSMWLLIPAMQWPKWIVRNSFAIFVIHYIVLTWGNIVCKYVGVPHAIAPILNFIAAIMISIVISEALRRRYPKLALLLLGGR